MSAAAVRCFIVAGIAAIVSWLLLPAIPEPKVAYVATIIGWVICAVAILYGLYLLLFGGSRRVP